MIVMRIRNGWFAFLCAAVMVLHVTSAAGSEPAPCVIARDGSLLRQVVVAENADESVRQSAKNLADMLGQMTGSPAEVAEGDGASGLAVGFADDFPALQEKFGDKLPPQWEEDQDLARAQRYVLISHSEGAAVIGTTQLAVEYGVWDILHHLGYRYFFPNENWEVIPDLSDAEVVLSLDEEEEPDYFDRRLWGAMTPEWSFRNRMSHHGWQTDFRPDMDDRWKISPIHTHHMYDGIIRFHEEEFEENPEYYALVDGERRGWKLCISSPNVQQLALDYARHWLDNNPHSLSVSMEPTDGYGWCECEECAELGTPSTRMIHLANKVAEGLEETHPNKWIGVLAYAHHAKPPEIEVHPQIAVQCATQLSGNIPFRERLAGWSEKASVVGVYEYYGITQWHMSMPGRMKGGDLELLGKTIPRFHDLGARMMSAESGSSWGPNGLGHLVAARLLWDTEADVQAVEDDFLDKSFGPAAEPMRKFYILMDNSRNPETAGELRPGSLEYFEDRYVRMYGILLEARELAGGDEAVLSRINDLLLYTRYVQLWCANRRAEGDQREEALQRLVRFAYQIRDTRMVHWFLLRQFIDGARNVDLDAPPPWLSDEEKETFEPEQWDRVTPALIEETVKEARRASGEH